jgi:hypothetical protein
MMRWGDKEMGRRGERDEEIPASLCPVLTVS